MRTKFFPAQPSTMGHLLNDLFNEDWSTLGMNRNESWSPKANIRENEDGWGIELAVPGMSKDSFKIELHDNRLNISAQVENKEEGEKYRYREFKALSFQRSFNLPKNMVDEDKISATYEHGVLFVNVPKLEEARDRGPRTIEIQ